MDLAITGANGFIGKEAVFHFTVEKRLGLRPCHTVTEIDRENAFKFASELHSTRLVDAVIHLGAITDTTSQDRESLTHYNLEYSKKIWNACVKNRIRLIYASSAATYGNGSQGFEDDTENLYRLQPLNPYAESKHEFDLWAIEQVKAGNVPPQWAGLKFFNVYGPHEENKGRMASMVYQATQQYIKTKKIKLFEFGEQHRDFIHVNDVYFIIDHMLNHPCYSIYNVGTGVSATFNQMARAVANALEITLPEITEVIEYIPIPESLVGAYQVYTQANISKLRTSFKRPMYSISDGAEEVARVLRHK